MALKKLKCISARDLTRTKSKQIIEADLYQSADNFVAPAIFLYVFILHRLLQGFPYVLLYSGTLRSSPKTGHRVAGFVLSPLKRARTFQHSEVTTRVPPLKYAYRYEYYLRQAGYVFAFVCLLVGMITRKVIDDFHNFHYAIERGLCRRPVSVRPSVRPSRWCIVSRRLKISSNFFLSPIAPSFCFFDSER